MSSSRSIAAEGGSFTRLRREGAQQRSLRECTTRKFTHYFTDKVGQKQGAPVLTSRVQWDNECIGKDDDISPTLIDDDQDLRHIEETEDHSYPSPVLSEIDELTQSDGDHSQFPSRPSTRNGAYITSSPETVDAGSPRSYTDSSDTERRNPNFPGGRNIIDDSTSSGSPSPRVAPNARLEPVSHKTYPPRNWKPSSAPNANSSLDLRLYPNQSAPTRDDRNIRIGLWRTDSAPQSLGPGPSSLARYSSSGMNRSPFNRSSSHSPSLTASSVPPSPPPILPPIRPHVSLHAPILPSVTTRMHGPVYWGTQEQSPPNILKRLSPHGHDSTDDYDFGDSASLGGSPDMHPHSLHGTPHSGSYSRLPASLNIRTPVVTRNKNAWKEHAQVVHGPNDQTEFRCVWRVGDSGSETDYCGYTAKRHLVKRHVETRHLQFKDHICPYCSKAFPQRVSLMIHVNRHTGEKPHKCRFDDCDKTFSDPARRHKHMVEAHGYNPQGPRKRHRTTDSYHANSHFETLAPWVAKADELDDESRR